MRKSMGNKATHTHTVTQKSCQKFDQLEQQFKAMCKDPSQKKLKETWNRLDFNGNGIVSLAEIDKMCVEAFPLLNHKPALMRAYKATIKTGNDDDWVQKKEFKTLLANLFYFNKIYWVFDQADGDDRRLTFDEFKKCLTLCGSSMAEADAKREFQSVDKNGGGIVLFDEFCAWFTSKKCPQAMT